MTNVAPIKDTSCKGTRPFVKRQVTAYYCLIYLSVLQIYFLTDRGQHNTQFVCENHRGCLSLTCCITHRRNNDTTKTEEIHVPSGGEKEKVHSADVSNSSRLEGIKV